MVRPRKEVDQKQTSPKEQSLLQRLQDELQLKQSYLSLILGMLIIIVAGILVFNYLKTNQALGPSQQTESPLPKEAQKDVEPDNLPGKYTVKEGDTLFKIAEFYYKDGNQFSKVSETNKLASPDYIETGQVLEIPKLDIVSSIPSPSPIETLKPDQTTKKDEALGIGGAINQTVWGETITSDTYTVVEGDWLSKIAGRAYGDIYTFDKITKANNILNPDLIYPGQVLKIPR